MHIQHYNATQMGVCNDTCVCGSEVGEGVMLHVYVEVEVGGGCDVTCVCVSGGGGRM